MSILIKNILYKKKITNIYIENNIIQEIGTKINEANHIIDGKNKAIIPGLTNTHTHAAMTLFRGYADDMELHEWLEKKIWPIEARLTEKEVYWGTKLACLEMIKSGTTTFNDMYFYGESAGKAVEEMGIRGVISEVFFDMFNIEMREKNIKKTKKGVEKLKNFKSDRIIPALGPHAVYTVSKEGLRLIKELADDENLLIHFHLGETRKENIDCWKQNGKRPVPYLEEIGFLGENLIAAHCSWIIINEIKILAKHGVKISHNPVSNMKLATGGVMPYSEMRENNLVISIGTDGAASNNNLDMFESMKFATLMQKAHRWDQTVMPAYEVYEMATINGAKALGLNAGVIEEGKLADVLLIDLKKPEMTPNHDLISNLVYSANGSCVDTTICNGKILMQNRKVVGEEELLEKAGKVALEFVK